MSATQTRRRAEFVPTPVESAPGGAPISQQAIPSSIPERFAPAGHISRPTIRPPATNVDPSGGAVLAGRQVGSDPHRAGAASDQTTDRHSQDDAHGPVAVGSDAERGPAAEVRTASGLLSLLDPALALAADVLDDLERVRISNENRLRQLTRSVEDSDGEVRGFGLDESHPDVARLAAMVDTLKKVEHDATLNLQRHMRRHPLGPWAKSIRGAGEKQVARLLAVIGDPYWRPEIVREDGATLPEGPRTVSALWAYSGLHVLPAGQFVCADQKKAAGGSGGDASQESVVTRASDAGVAPKRARGQKANWSTKAKTRAYLIALSFLKQLVKPCHNRADGPAVHVDDCSCSPYRVVYDRRRAHTAVTRPDWTDGHAHNDALRVTAKEFLKDLWREAKRIHEGVPTP